ncbi:MAG: hypothetical protein IJ629_01605 [Clostridia bacterium]|nr:hypothetical protein [Clostridia bacterium]
MINKNYAKAYKEVLEIIKFFPADEYNKIPKEKIEFYKTNMDSNYEFTINPEIDLSEQKISKEANAIIVTLFQDYFATKEQKEKINEILILNEKKAEQEKSEKYNPDSIFNFEDKKQINIQDNALVEYEDNFFIRFKNFILKLLHLKS